MTIKPLWLALPLALLLAACGNDTPTTATTDGTAQPATAPPARKTATLTGVWQPRTPADAQADSTLQALVLEDNGQLYLVGDEHHHGVNWQRQDDGTVRLNYLGRSGNHQGAQSDNVAVNVTETALTLSGDSPFAGEYQRNGDGIESVSGQVVLPEGEPTPEHAVLVVSLREADSTSTPGKIVNHRLMRLQQEGNTMPFRLYFSHNRLQATQHYGLDARVIADGTVQWASNAIVPLPDTRQKPVTLTLHPPGIDPSPATDANTAR